MQEDDFDEEDDEDDDDDDEENPFGGSNNEVLHSTLLARMDRSVGGSMGRSAVNPFTESLLLQVFLVLTVLGLEIASPIDFGA